MAEGCKITSKIYRGDGLWEECPNLKQDDLIYSDVNDVDRQKLLVSLCPIYMYIYNYVYKYIHIYI